MAGPFHRSAHVYDLVYSHLDYATSAAYVEGLIRERNAAAASLLDVACGTGLHLGIWRDQFEHVEGVDLDPNMLAMARQRLRASANRRALLRNADGSSAGGLIAVRLGSPAPTAESAPIGAPSQN